MNDKRPSLDQIERWMQSVIMHPGGVAEAVESPEARRHLDVGLANLESVICRSQALEASARLEIYVDAYYERLLECLSEEFTATRRALSDELFHAVAFGYLRNYPSRSYTLNLLGANFPKYLAESRLHERATPPEAGATWGEFIVELATFERLLRDVFDGPGSEGCEGLDLAELSSIPPENWHQLRLKPAECLRIARFEHAVHEYWAAIRNDGQPDAIRARPALLAINRRDYVVERHELAPPQFMLLEQLMHGQSLAQAIALLVASAGMDAKELERALREWFAVWTSQRFFIGLERATSPG
jgi:hypothetical protein